MKKMLFILLGILILLIGACAQSSPIQSTISQVYSGVLTGINLVPDGYTATPGTITLDNTTIVFGYFVDIKGEALRDLTLGAYYRLLFKEQGTHFSYYYIEKIKEK
jgi:hypothetical protein